MTSLQIEEFIKLASISDGGPIHISGLSYTMNVKKNDNNNYEIINVSVIDEDAKYLNYSKLYRVAMNDYMERTVNFDFEDGPFDIGMTTIEADLEYLKNHQLNYKDERRYHFNVLQ